MSEQEQQSEYRVLARKYRPQDFSALIGQEALVQTLSNAIDANRLAHAFILTGVRGVGKTTTARIIAKALNCLSTDGPTTQPCGTCDNCVAITNDRHPDVLEMDAASRTGVDDIREIIDSVRYRPTNARFKVYIIDEVHMLSKNAFNALLKTLEEPPSQVKFIFATTEIRKVPITVLSRCQRFDLRRVDVDVLTTHFQNICQQESWDMDDEAAKLIATAADGSVRDGLSILDQAGALGEGKITGADVQHMLGLADRQKVQSLFDALQTGNNAEALQIADNLYAYGADPIIILQDLLQLTHTACRSAALENPEQLPALTRTWQILLKGLTEVNNAPQPHLAVEMIFIRLMHAAGLPSPGEIIQQLQKNPPASSANQSSGESAATAKRGTSKPTTSPATSGVSPTASGGGASAAVATQTAAQPSPAPASDTQPELLALPQTFTDAVELFKEKREAILHMHLMQHVHLVQYKVGRIEWRVLKDAPKDLAGKVGTLLTEWTGERWMISVSQEEGAPTLKRQEELAAQAAIEAAKQKPEIQSILMAFPGAVVTKVDFQKKEKSAKKDS